MKTRNMNAVLELLGDLALEEFIAEIRNLCRSKEPIKETLIGYFTPHGASHFSGVEHTIERLLLHQKPDTTKPEGDATRIPSAVERLILRFCAWGHDVGMLREVSERFYQSNQVKDCPSEWGAPWARKYHDEASSYFITTKLDEITETILDSYSTEADDDSSNTPAVRRNKDERKLHQENLRELFKSHSQKDHLEEFIRYLAASENRDSIRANLACLANTVALIASFHRRQRALEECPLHRDVLGVTIRARLLATIFRLADALHVDQSRFSHDQFRAIRYQSDFSPESRRHWMKSYLVSSISINDDTHSLEVQMDLPDCIQPDDERPLSQQASASGRLIEKRRHIISGMRDFIVNDLEEDLLSVSGILWEHSFPPLLRVTSYVHIVPPTAYSEDIWSVLDDLNALASPNTSQLINSALSSIKEIYTAPHKHQHPLDSAKLRLGGFREMLDKRPCHEGLKKIESLFKALVSIFDSEWDRKHYIHPITDTDFVDESEFLKVCLEGAHTTFLEQRKECMAVVRSGRLDDCLPFASNVVLYGCSEQAIELLGRLLSKYPQQPLPRIYVLECRTKTQYTPTGRLIYHDGLRFATSIREVLDPSCQIILTPDFAIARILEDASRRNEKTLVLLGSNAITLDGHLVHSMGHAAVAAVAKSPRYAGYAEVYVLTDGLKIGGLIREVRPHEGHQRNEDQWLSHDPRVQQTLERATIVTKNWQEDIVPTDLISCILVLDAGRTIKGNDEDLRNTLAELAFKPDVCFNEKLHIRVVASKVRSYFNDAEHNGLYHAIYGSKLMSGKKIKDLDGLCFVIAEEAVNGRLTEENRDAVEHFRWLALLDCALDGARQLQEPIARFAVRLTEIYAELRKTAAASVVTPLKAATAEIAQKARKTGAGAA